MKKASIIAVRHHPAVDPPIIALPERLKSETRLLHARAERAGVMGELLGRRVGRAAYCALLRNLHAIYQALETALDGLPAAAPARGLWHDTLRRAPRLAADLEVLHGPGWAAMPLAAATVDYVERLEQVRHAPALAAHAYVRYLGDLNGGQALAFLVRERFAGAGAAATAFYEFGADIGALRDRFRSALARLGLEAADDAAVVAEARWAFEAHVRLFEELQAS
jgi:heme oxygenase